MKNERWKSIEAVFHAASELPAEARRDYLDQQCDNDIRPDVRSLDSKGVGHLWSVPAAGGAPTRLVDSKEPDRIEFATDGKEFFFSLTERESDLWILKLRK